MKNDAPAPRVRPLWSRSFLYRTAVGSLLAVYAVMAFVASTHKGPAFDEPSQITAGYNNWQHHDFRLMAANGDFLKRWATLPLLISQPTLPPTTQLEYRKGVAHAVGYLFFFRAGNSPEMLLLECRAMMLLLGVALGLLIYFCAREVAGPVGGLAAVSLFAFSPNMLAFGGTVATEIPLALALLGTTWCLWHLFQRTSWGWLAGSLGFTAMLALTRPSALVIVPIALLLAVAKLMARRPLVWGLGRERTIYPRWRQLAIITGLLLLHSFVAWSAIWANYEFRYAAGPNTPQPSSTVPDFPGATTLRWARTTHFLPQAYVDGAYEMLGGDDVRQTFLDGEWNVKGWSGFLLAVAWEKSSPALLLFLALGLWSWGYLLFNRWRRRQPPAAVPQEGFVNTYAALPFVVLLVAYFTVIAAQTMDFGQRSVLPGFPALYILGSVGATWVWNLRARWIRALLVSLLLWRSSEALLIYPNYLAYFNPFVGGPAEGYQHLVDKSLDWGMDLPSLKDWLDQYNPQNRIPVYLAYFGTDDVDHNGIQCLRLPGYPNWTQRSPYPLTPGIYAISATLYQTLNTAVFGPWNKVYEEQYQACIRDLQAFDRTADNPAARALLVSQHPPGYWENLYVSFEQLRFARLCSWLRHHEAPHAYAGYSILIWRLTDIQLQAALISPPSELADAPQ